MYNYFKIIICSILLFVLCEIGVSQDCSAALAGDMEATALAIQPSAPISSCDKATVIAEWTNTSLFLNDLTNACHLGTFNIALPPAFLGTTGTATIVATDGGLYFDVPVCTDSQCDVDLLPGAVIPDGIIVTFMVADMEIADDQNYVNQQVTSQIQWIAVDADGLNDDLTIASETTTSCGMICGNVFLDNYADGTNANQSGTGTGNDDPIEGITVTLLDCGKDLICGNVDDQPSKTVMTDSNGDYCFNDLSFSNYRVEFGMNDGNTTYDEFTTQNTGDDDLIDSEVTSGSSGGQSEFISITLADLNEDNVDAGLFEYATISGTLYEDNDGTNGTVAAASASDIIVVEYCDNPTACDMTYTISYPVTTDANGDYTITDVIPGVVLSINATTYSTFEEDSVVNSQNLNANSGGAIEDQNFALPVGMLYFKVTKIEKKSMLEWATSQEFNNDYFELQHSLNGMIFNSIGIINGQGTSFKTTIYEFEHTEPALGENYYRLKQFDFDGKFNYSEVKVLSFVRSNALDLKVYPIPTYDNVSLLTTQDLVNHKVVLLDKMGRQLRTFDFTNQMIIALDNYASGIYFIKLVDSNGNVVKERKLINIK